MHAKKCSRSPTSIKWPHGTLVTFEFHSEDGLQVELLPSEFIVSTCSNKLLYTKLHL
jgi:hypothetical protein